MTVVNSVLPANYAWSAFRTAGHPVWLWPSGTQLGGGFYDTATGQATSIVGPVTGAGPWTANASGLAIDAGTVGATAPFAYSYVNAISATGGWTGTEWELWVYAEDGAASLFTASGPLAYGSSPGPDFFGRFPVGVGTAVNPSTFPLLYQRTMDELAGFNTVLGRSIAFQNTEPPVGNDIFLGSVGLPTDVSEGDYDLLSVGSGDGGGVLWRQSARSNTMWTFSLLGLEQLEDPTDTSATQVPYPASPISTVFPTVADYTTGSPTTTPFPAVFRATRTGFPAPGFDFLIVGAPAVAFGGGLFEVNPAIPLPPLLMPDGVTPIAEATTNCGPGVVVQSCAAANLLPPTDPSGGLPFQFSDQLIVLRVTADQKQIWATPITLCHYINDPSHRAPDLLAGTSVLWQQAGPGEFFGPIDGGWLPAPVNKGAVWFVVGGAPDASGPIAFSFLPRLTYPTCGIGCSSFQPSSSWRQVHIIG